MAEKNAFFQLIDREEGTFLRLIPAREGGSIVSRQEIQDYLTVRGIANDSMTLAQALMTLDGSSEEIEIRLSGERTQPQDEAVLMQVAEDAMVAEARFYAPSDKGKRLDKGEIVEALQKQGLRYGVKEEIIDRFLQERNYCTYYRIAEGIAPVEGKDAVLQYFFNTEPDSKPKLLKDGSVDFFNLNTISQCQEGDVLAQLTREVPGRPGINVLGEPVRPREVKKFVLKYGKNILVSEDKTSLISKVNGHVLLVEGKVIVSSSYEVENVDVSTGNVVYDGNVQVSGNVMDGFSIKAGGDVVVNGVVEGAYIEAGGHITIARGMNGMGRGRLKAGGNVISKFIENAVVEAQGFVETDAIIHSQVSSATEVIVTGRRGFITGGMVRAASTVSAKTIGSGMGMATRVEVGVDPIMKERHGQLRQSIMSAKKTLDAVAPTLAAAGKRLGQGEKYPPEQMRYIKQLSVTSRELEAQLKLDMKELADIEKMLEAETTAQVKVSGVIYPGTTVVISDVSLPINEAIQYCRFIKYQGAVTMTSL